MRVDDDQIGVHEPALRGVVRHAPHHDSFGGGLREGLREREALDGPVVSTMGLRKRNHSRIGLQVLGGRQNQDPQSLLAEVWTEVLHIARYEVGGVRTNGAAENRPVLGR